MSPSATAMRAIILAAGHGTRTKQSLPKVLQPVAGKPMLHWVLQSAAAAGNDAITLVLGRDQETIERSLAGLKLPPVHIALQPKPLGTADAVRVALQSARDRAGYVLVLYGDCPLIPASLLKVLGAQTQQTSAVAGLVSSQLEQPFGYGRILRDSNGHISAIREEKDCSESQKLIQEINPGIYCFQVEFLAAALDKVQSSNAQKELYLTDVIEQAAALHKLVEIHYEMQSLRGVNDLVELARINTLAYQQIAAGHAQNGVRIESLNDVYIDATCIIEPDASLGVGVHLRGNTHVGQSARIDVGSVLQDCTVGANAYVQPYTLATSAEIGSSAQVGPFSHLRTGSVLHENAKVGNFSETKNTVIGAGSKVNHLSYVGDGRIGKNVNIGAGTIFCNYNGVSKEITTIEDNVFIGSDSQLIAPVHIGEGAYIASGSTINRNVPRDALAISRSKQENKEGYAKRLLARLKGVTRKT